MDMFEKYLKPRLEACDQTLGPGVGMHTVSWPSTSHPPMQLPGLPYDHMRHWIALSDAPLGNCAGVLCPAGRAAAARGERGEAGADRAGGRRLHRAHVPPGRVHQGDVAARVDTPSQEARDQSHQGPHYHFYLVQHELPLLLADVIPWAMCRRWYRPTRTFWSSTRPSCHCTPSTPGRTESRRPFTCPGDGSPRSVLIMACLVLYSLALK